MASLESKNVKILNQKPWYQGEKNETYTET